MAKKGDNMLSEKRKHLTEKLNTPEYRNADTGGSSHRHLPHVMNVSATMMGLCFIVLTTAEDVHIRNPQIIDALASVSIILFTGSTILSFLSYRSMVKSARIEAAADYIFLTGILFIAISTFYIIFQLHH